ncbi:hypothetical protein [Pinibacter soli]|uniref:Beta-lactamase-inhibitor-like PepSY-like domain-containing protein n=1 Tax=Pinibacter soli TaxID=3044211 RepID=A0ABT6RFC6_9BACT|nr:hypothetical protein [Pinibacter soli]MDI3320567.1 hypothetical protein [Pinibacter soli]
MIAIRRLLFLSLLNVSIVSCEQHAKIIVQDVRITESVDDVAPPAPEEVSHFKTLQDWLVNVCDSSKPQKTIDKFKLGIFEGENEKILYLVGTNTYKEGENQSAIRIEFEPAHNYLLLPEKEYNLAHKELVDKLTGQLKDFTNTSTFQNSFLTKANTVVFETNGQVIWKKGS